MKKLFLTTVVALFSLAASAQFLVATELSKTDDGEGGESYSIEGLTNNMSFGYEVMDKITVGITMKDATMNTAAVEGVDSTSSWNGLAGVDSAVVYNGDYVAAADEVENGTIVSDMQVFVRYAVSDEMFIQVTTPMDSDVEGVSSNDLMRVGAGYKFNVWGDVNAEFNYSMKVNGGDDGDRGGKMGIGLSMTF